MADECVSCQEGFKKEKAWNEEPSSRESPDKDLQMIFKKLRVDNRPKRLRKKARTCSLSSEVEDANSNHRRCVLKKPTFVYKSGHLRQNKKSKEAGSKRVAAELNTDDKLEATSASSTKQAVSKQLKQELVKSTVELRDITSGCGEQHRRAQSVGSCTDLNLDDTTPEELAAYFEQLLHIPKPMSAMAEMMYT